MFDAAALATGEAIAADHLVIEPVATDHALVEHALAIAPPPVMRLRLFC